MSIGNPHFVIFVDTQNFECFGRSWQQIGAEICVHPDFPKGTNVEFVRVIDTNRIEFRIYERGVGPTLSSGTGTSASAAASIEMQGRCTTAGRNCGGRRANCGVDAKRFRICC